MNLPKGLFYSKEHAWLKVENNTGLIGITEFAQGELGEIVYVDLPNDGYNFKQNEVFGSVEAIKTVSDLFMPLGGKVIETNKKLLQEPTLVNTDPYGEGWMMKIELKDNDEIKKLLSIEQYKETVGG